ncbi:hypothetical protein QTJ16_003186 [Diplocarpon rosae]|uniref:Protection of telomeres protein 1 n=1 Tax=Diplocarpon rosae TaxID=946125 RepID=A0AAD9T0R2_9HELO|nr:hypothetical protein QTJ16_003186 [Diplocarpon rosae]PBP21360.1 hypothetical protein BUE80_DR007806 [Diplocarpon rosae]
MNNSVDSSPAKPPLPPGFHSIEEVYSLSNEQVRAGPKINIIGFVKDYQAPKRTSRGGDFKCTLELMDPSIQHEIHGIKFNIFWPENHMPIISNSGSIVLVRNVKVQMYNGNISLLTHWSTQVYVLQSLTTSDVQWQSCKPNKTQLPNSAENTYVTWLKGQTQYFALPSTQEFQDQTIQATNIRDKFSLLKSLKPNGKFHDILGEVVKIYDLKSSLTVYVSDYTSNPKFFNYISKVEDEKAYGSRDGDEHGYTKARSKIESSWPGPFGQQTIQLTLYDEHADFMRDNASVGQWVHLKNVQMKLGKEGGKLEGFMRGDRGKINVRLIQPSDNPDERWKDALRRKKDYLKKVESEKGQGLTDDFRMGNKRKSEDVEPSKLNSKQRRKERREAARRAAIELEARAAKKLDLNDNIRCAHPDIETVHLKDILKPEMILQGGSAIPSPFTVRKYRANVRVVDYAPNRIEDFAVWYRETDFDMLSDNSGDEETDDEADMRSYRNGKGFADKKWEWRFWLQVEEASVKGAKERLWVIVDNHAAQGLLNFEDEKMDRAKNLRKDHNLLTALKEQLFKLWGDLEEQKSEMLPPLELEDTQSPSLESSTGILPREIGAQPDVDSESEADDSPDTRPGAPDKQISAGPNPKNKAFTCCIRQYGIREVEEDPAKANAGVGRRWQRVFGLFGTQIM